MLTQTERPSTRILAIACAFAVIGMIGLALRSTSSRPPATTGSAMLEVAGIAYEFDTSTCGVTETDFLAAVSGQVDGQDFWISVSPEAAELAIGTADERARSDDGGDLWLMGAGEVTWTAADQTVTAELTMRNQRIADASVLPGRFTATCST
mgnify:CR=1 FL=1